LGGPGWIVCGRGADSMLEFRLERGDDEMKRYRKMKQRQRARLDSMERKHDTARWRDDVGRRRGSTGEGKREKTTPIRLT
jgi:hypothetical protein